MLREISLSIFVLVSTYFLSHSLLPNYRYCEYEFYAFEMKEKEEPTVCDHFAHSVGAGLAVFVFMRALHLSYFSKMAPKTPVTVRVKAVVKESIKNIEREICL